MMKYSMRWVRQWSIGVLALLVMAVSSADITTDGSLGPVTQLTGPTMTIDASLGQQRGANLFHSFRNFDIQQGETATFTGPNTISTVISRVTGGQASTIAGTLRSTIGQADVLLLNPAGVLIGAGAEIDVPAAFHVSTADEVRFADGQVFSARHPGASSLTSAPPEAFGFLTPQAAAIEVQGAQLTVKDGQALSLTAGDITIEESTLTAPGGVIRLDAVGKQAATVALSHESVAVANGGTLHLSNTTLTTDGVGGGRIDVNAGQATLIDTSLSATNSSVTDAVAGIALQVKNRLQMQRAEVSVGTIAAGAAGDLQINAGQFDLLEESQLETWTFASGNAGSVSLTVDDLLAVWSRSAISSRTNNSGDAGTITIAADSVLMDATGFDFDRVTGILSLTSGDASGHAGDILLHVYGSLDLNDGAEISNRTWGSGNAGTITIEADSVQMADAQMISQANDRAGSAILLHVHGLLDLNDGAEISNYIGGSGNAGAITIAADSVQMADASRMISEASDGTSGAILLQVHGLLDLNDGAQISSRVDWGSGDAGPITIAADSVRMHSTGSDMYSQISSYADEGSSGAILLQVHGLLDLNDGAQISSRVNVVWGFGDAGPITIAADSVQMAGASRISSEASDGSSGDILLQVHGLLDLNDGAWISNSIGGSGNAGTITIEADSVQIARAGSDQFTGIASQVYPEASGDAGDILLHVHGLLDLNDGAEISNSTSGSGDAGTITIEADSVQIARAGSDRFTGITSQVYPEASGDAGDILLHVHGLLDLNDGAEISNSTWGSGDAGTITIEADSVQIDGFGSHRFTGIFSEASLGSNGHAGDVLLLIDHSLTMQGDAVISTRTAGSGDAGRIAITADTLTVNDSQIENTTSATGDAGYIGIQTNTITISGANSSISSEARDGASGHANDISIHANQRLTISDNAKLTTATSGIGTAGTITVDAPILELRGGHIISDSTGSGNAGTIHVAAGQATISHGAQIASRSRGSGAAGRIDLIIDRSLALMSDAQINTNTQGGGAAGDIRIQAQSTDLQRSIISSTTYGAAPAGHIELLIERALTLMDQTHITTDTSGAGAGGHLAIQADAITMTGDSRLTSNTSAEGNAGYVTLVAPQIQLTDSQIASTTSASGDAGKLTIRNPGTLSLNHSQLNTETTGAGAAGEVLVLGNELVLANHSRMSSRTTGDGAAGTILLKLAGPVTMRDQSHLYTDTHGRGAGGDIQLRAQAFSLQNSKLTSDTTNTGAGGNIHLILSNQFALTPGAQVSTDTAGLATAGNITIKAHQLNMTNAQLSSQTAGAERAGSIDLLIEQSLHMMAQAQINTDSSGDGSGGSIVIQAQAATLEDSDIRSNTSGGGQAGKIELYSADIRLFNTAAVTTSSSGRGSGGLLTIYADTVQLNDASLSSIAEAEGDAGIIDLVIAQSLALQHHAVINTSTTGSGDAGAINVHSPQIALMEAQLFSDTTSAGNAGYIHVYTEQLEATGADARISTSASAAATGASGQITIQGYQTSHAEQVLLQHGAQILSTAQQREPADLSTESALQIQTRTLTLDDGAHISAESTGPVAAGAVMIDAHQAMRLAGQSHITTQADDANAGPITITTEALRLNHSTITTSAGRRGDGGDITLTACQLLLLHGGMIQANTQATGARGGAILINTPLLLASYGLLDIGGEQPYAFNPDRLRSVIQAAAPGGVSGTIRLSDPVFDLAALSAAPQVPLTDTAHLFNNVCDQLSFVNPSRLVDELHGLHSWPTHYLSTSAQLPWSARRVQALLEAERKNADCVDGEICL
jgi:filamentous hemagglutinin family protein